MDDNFTEQWIIHCQKILIGSENTFSSGYLVIHHDKITQFIPEIESHNTFTLAQCKNIIHIPSHQYILPGIIDTNVTLHNSPYDDEWIDNKHLSMLALKNGITTLLNQSITQYSTSQLHQADNEDKWFNQNNKESNDVQHIQEQNDDYSKSIQLNSSESLKIDHPQLNASISDSISYEKDRLFQANNSCETLYCDCVNVNLPTNTSQKVFKSNQQNIKLFTSPPLDPNLPFFHHPDEVAQFILHQQPQQLSLSPIHRVSSSTYLSDQDPICHSHQDQRNSRDIPAKNSSMFQSLNSFQQKQFCLKTINTCSLEQQKQSQFNSHDIHPYSRQSFESFSKENNEDKMNIVKEMIFFIHPSFQQGDNNLSLSSPFRKQQFSQRINVFQQPHQVGGDALRAPFEKDYEETTSDLRELNWNDADLKLYFEDIFKASKENSQNYTDYLINYSQLADYNSDIIEESDKMQPYSFNLTKQTLHWPQTHLQLSKSTNTLYCVSPSALKINTDFDKERKFFNTECQQDLNKDQFLTQDSVDMQEIAQHNNIKLNQNEEIYTESNLVLEDSRSNLTLQFLQLVDCCDSQKLIADFEGKDLVTHDSSSIRIISSPQQQQQHVCARNPDTPADHSTVQITQKNREEHEDDVKKEASPKTSTELTPQIKETNNACLTQKSELNYPPVLLNSRKKSMFKGISHSVNVEENHYNYVEINELISKSQSSDSQIQDSLDEGKQQSAEDVGESNYKNAMGTSKRIQNNNIHLFKKSDRKKSPVNLRLSTTGMKRSNFGDEFYNSLQSHLVECPQIQMGLLKVNNLSQHRITMTLSSSPMIRNKQNSVFIDKQVNVSNSFIGSEQIVSSMSLIERRKQSMMAHSINLDTSRSIPKSPHVVHNANQDYLHFLSARPFFWEYFALQMYNQVFRKILQRISVKSFNSSSKCQADVSPKLEQTRSTSLFKCIDSHNVGRFIFQNVSNGLSLIRLFTMKKKFESFTAISVEVSWPFLFFDSTQITLGDTRFKTEPAIQNFQNKQILQSSLFKTPHLIDIVGSYHFSVPVKFKLFNCANVQPCFSSPAYQKSLSFPGNFQRAINGLFSLGGQLSSLWTIALAQQIHTPTSPPNRSKTSSSYSNTTVVSQTRKNLILPFIVSIPSHFKKTSMLVVNDSLSPTIFQDKDGAKYPPRQSIQENITSTNVVCDQVDTNRLNDSNAVNRMCESIENRCYDGINQNDNNVMKTTEKNSDQNKCECEMTNKDSKTQQNEGNSQVLNDVEEKYLIRICDVLSRNPAKICNLPEKGSLQPGKHADFFVFDPFVQHEFSAHVSQDQKFAPELHILNSQSVVGQVISTYLRGQKVYHSNTFFLHHFTTLSP